MAEYGYMRRRYVSQEQSRPGNRNQAWDSSYNGVETDSDGWNRTGFVGNGEGYHDHVCRPVIIDAEGRKRPLIACTPNHNTDGFVTKTETIVEQHVRAPLVTGYKHSSPTTDYGVVNSGWSRPVSPPRDRPPRVEEYISNVQTEASRPKRTGLLSSTYWRQTPSPNGYGATNGYVGVGDTSTNDWHRPSGNTSRPLESPQEPTMITTGGWARPSRAGWATPPSDDSPLSKPTNDIGTAIDYLKQATTTPSATPFTTQRRFTVPPPAGTNTYTQAIDSREAARRYGGASASPQVAETYSSSIDSREAARRYSGQLM